MQVLRRVTLDFNALESGRIRLVTTIRLNAVTAKIMQNSMLPTAFIALKISKPSLLSGNGLAASSPCTRSPVTPLSRSYLLFPMCHTALTNLQRRKIFLCLPRRTRPAHTRAKEPGALRSGLGVRSAIEIVEEVFHAAEILGQLSRIAVRQLGIGLLLDVRLLDVRLLGFSFGLGGLGLLVQRNGQRHLFAGAVDHHLHSVAGVDLFQLAGQVVVALHVHAVEADDDVAHLDAE